MTAPPPSARRRLLLKGMLAGGGLLLGYGLFKSRDLIGPPTLLARPDSIALNGYLTVTPDGIVTVAVPRVEMGQGVHTALPMLVAEEMDADWSKVRVRQAPIDPFYVNIIGFTDTTPYDEEDAGTLGTTLRWTYARIARVLGVQITGGSASVRDAWLPLRTAGACAREQLLQAAALELGVPSTELTITAGSVTHPKSGATRDFGELATRAATVKAPTRPPLKAAATYQLLGKPLARLDIPSKVNGSAQFGIDINAPDMLYGAVRTSPVLGARLVHANLDAVLKLPGVVAAVALENGIAVAAHTTWHAQRAATTAELRFAEPTHLGSLVEVNQSLSDALQAGDFFCYEKLGEAETQLASAEQKISARYQVPLLAHACLEPMNCTVRIDGDHAEIWAGSQAPDLMQRNAARALDIPRENVTVHTPLLGGGFGRRAEPDAMLQTLQLARAVPGKPVKLTWSRAEDFQHDQYRMPALAEIAATLDARGRISAWHARIASPDLAPVWLGRLLPGLPIAGPDRTSVDGAVYLPYAMPHRRIDHTAVSVAPLPIGPWRSVGHSSNAFFVECFMDELARAAGQDAFDFRLAHLTARPRETAVLSRLRTLSQWDSPVAAGRARGLALCKCYGSVVAQVAEVSLQDGQPVLHQITCVVDCGMVVNPDIVKAQLESGIIFGASAALWGQVPYAAGRITIEGFHQYRLLTLRETPDIVLDLIASDASPGGIGETATPPVAPALANAFAALTGDRRRELPLFPT